VVGRLLARKVKKPYMPHSVVWPAEPPKLTVDELRRFLPTRPSEAMDTYGKRHLVVCLYVFEKFLGWDWCERHLLQANKGFLWLDFSTLEKRETTTVRIFELADNIFSLQTIPGLSGCLDQLRSANVESGQVESTYAELEFGRILSLYDVQFRFVPRGAKKSADFELSYPDGLVILADSKCKLEGSAFSENTIKNSLRDAKELFPKDGAGIAFIKIPQAWADDANTRVLMYRAAVSYLTETARIASVKFYAEFLEFDPKVIRRRYGFLEVSNPKSRIQPGRDWTLFEGRSKAPAWGATNSKWIDLGVVANEGYGARS
jgi:hypothetical protein